jgi:hypothetical protein
MTAVVLEKATEDELQLQKNRIELRKLQNELDQLIDELRLMLRKR